jgi:hypothetical protein
MMTGKRCRYVSHIRAAFFALLSIGAAGCAQLPRFSPIGVLQDAPHTSALCESLRGRAAGHKGFRSLLVTRLTANDETYSFRYAVVGRSLAADSHDLRVDLLPEQGAYTLGLLTVRDGRALMIDSQERRFASDCAPDRLFAKFFGLEGITPDLVRALLVGHVPALACEALQIYRQDPERLQILDRSMHRVWEVDETSGELRAVQLLNSEHTKVYARAQRGQTPQDNFITISIFNPLEASAEMQVKKFTINPPLSEGLFDVVAPAGYVREECP